MVDIGLRHQLEELAGIGRQRFDIAALAFGIDGVEGEGGFARAAEPGDHRQPVLGQVDIDALQIVLARAADAYVSQHGAVCSRFVRARQARR